jgi:DUF4097 and DUF4098 domain-containing protein YvlB
MKFNVKKFTLWLAVTMIISFAIAAAIFLVSGSFSINAMEIERAQIDESKAFNAQDINKIHIDTASTDINIISTDEEEIGVHFYGEVSTNKKMELPSLIAYESGDELRIGINQPKIILVGISIWNINLDVYVPKDSIETLKIDTVSSNTSISDLKVNEFIFKTVSGDFHGESLFASDLKLGLTSGNVNLKNYTGNIDIKVISGDVVLEDGNQNDNIEIVTTSGNVYVEQEDSSNMNISTTSGDVEINFSEDAQFYLKAKTVSGDVGNRFPITITSTSERYLEGIVGSDEKKINISTTSGNVDIISKNLK